jgi:hypothetical protein
MKVIKITRYFNKTQLGNGLEAEQTRISLYVKHCHANASKEIRRSRIVSTSAVIFR